RRFEEDFRQKDSTAQVQPDALLQRGHDAAQNAKIDVRRLAQGCPGNVWVNVNHVGAHRDVDRAGDTRPMTGKDKTAVDMRTIQIVEVFAERGAEADLVFRAVAGGDREGVRRLAGHAELTDRQTGGDVFAGFAGEGQLEVVDRRGPVHRYG